MKTGLQEIKDIIFNHLKRSGYRGGVGIGKLSKDTAEEIYELLERNEDMNKGWNAAHDFAPELEKVARRLEKGLSLGLFKRTPEAAEVYKWVIEKEKNGESLDVWMTWAMNPDRVKYVGKYRANITNIVADWPQAFDGRVKGYNPQNLEIGF